MNLFRRSIRPFSISWMQGTRRASGLCTRIDIYEDNDVRLVGTGVNVSVPLIFFDKDGNVISMRLIKDAVVPEEQWIDLLILQSMISYGGQNTFVFVLRQGMGIGVCLSDQELWPEVMTGGMNES